MDFNVSEWLNLVFRWIHVFAAIMWIGQTYFFTWLDGQFSRLLKSGGMDTGEDRVWMVHSGGFYVVEKQRIPKLMPGALHWFKWEAAITWLSGVALLVIVYYMGGIMVEDLANETSAILLGIASIALAWPAYHLLWQSAIAKNELVGAMLSFGLVVLMAFGLTQVMGGRAAYIHMGAIFATIMTANVWMIILPAQRKLVAALTAREQPDLALAYRAKLRSKHNTFMVVPVVLLMISNHFPTATYGTTMNWFVLSLLVLVGWGAAKILRRA